MTDEKSLVPKLRFPGFTGAWERRKLGDTADILTGFSFQSQNFSNYGIMLIRGTNVKRGYLDFSKGNTVYWPNSYGLDKYLLAENDIVIQMDGALIGKSYACISKEDVPSLLVQRVARLRCNNRINSSFIYQSIQRNFLKYVKQNKTETAVPHLSSSDINNYVVVIPSNDEQQKVGAFFKQLDDLIALYQRKLSHLEQLKKGLLQKMFPKHGESYPEIRFPGFTGAWQQRKLGDIGKVQSGVGFPVAEQGVHDGVPFFKVSDLNKIGNEYEMKKSNNYVSISQIQTHKWKPIRTVPAIIFAKVGAAIMLDRKRIVRFPFLMDNNTMAYSLGSSWDAYFGKTLFETIHLSKYVQVGALPSYNSSDIESINVVIPNLIEQRKIGAFFKQLDDLITLHQRKLSHLQQLKKALLQQMFV